MDNYLKATSSNLPGGAVGSYLVLRELHPYYCCNNKLESCGKLIDNPSEELLNLLDSGVCCGRYYGGLVIAAGLLLYVPCEVMDGWLDLATQ